MRVIWCCVFVCKTSRSSKTRAVRRPLRRLQLKSSRKPYTRRTGGRFAAISRNSRSRSAERRVARSRHYAVVAAAAVGLRHRTRLAGRRVGEAAGRHVGTERHWNCAAARQHRADKCRAGGRQQRKHRVDLLASRKRSSTGLLIDVVYVYVGMLN